MTRDSDLTLIERARGGEEAAFFALYERHKGAVFRFAKRMLLDDGLAADVVQEVFEYFFRMLPDYRPEAKVTTLLLKAARHRALNLLEKRRRRDAAPLEADRAPADAGAVDPGAAAEQRDLAQKAREALGGLEPIHREVIVLKVMRNLTYEEIGEILGVPAGTVKSRLHNGLEALRKKMKFE
jgi:RNA polymerase sigma-70 factor (ECF subfamily)